MTRGITLRRRHRHEMFRSGALVIVSIDNGEDEQRYLEQRDGYTPLKLWARYDEGGAEWINRKRAQG